MKMVMTIFRRVAVPAALLLILGVAEGGYALSKRSGMTESIKVDVLTVKGCKATPTMIERITNISEAMQLPVKIGKIFIETREEAEEKRFFGSPTVRIDGLEMERGMRVSTKFGVG